MAEFADRMDERHDQRHPHAMNDIKQPGVESATATDAAAVIALWQVCGLTRPWNDPAADYARAVAGEHSAILVSRNGDAIAASIMVGEDGHRGWVYYLAVAPDRRRAGLGARMMTAAEAWLRARGVPKIQLMVREGNEDALAFYAALGLERQPVITLGRFFGD
ncbi:MAG TPA: GNAT family acetyltransferase [Sphingomonas sp.]|nr:GNAT family acetyltransferase [Sphingomonas sp.]